MKHTKFDLEQSFFYSNKQYCFIYSFLIAWLRGYFTFSDSSVVSLKSSPWTKYTKYETIFQKKIMFYSQTFFRLQICSLLDCSYTKIGGHRACSLTNCCERWTWFLRSQYGWIICSAGTGARYKIMPIESCSKCMHSRSSLFSVVFMCLISPTQKFKLEKSTINTKEWGKSRFDEILELWIFILDYFVAPAFCLIPVS